MVLTSSLLPVAAEADWLMPNTVASNNAEVKIVVFIVLIFLVLSCLFVIFNDQRNNLFGVRKNEIDHRFKGIDKGLFLVCKRYFIDNEYVLHSAIV